MTEKNLPNEKPKDPSRSLKGVMSKTELEHQYKLSLMRECQIYGKSLKECKVYFADKGYSLSKTLFTKMRNELKSRKSAKNWFSDEALYVIEEDHMLSVGQIRIIQDKIVNQITKLIKDDDFETKEHFDTSDKGISQRVENYNLELFMKLTATFESLQMTKTKMFSATPMVQELMEVHARQEAEETDKQEMTHEVP